MDKTRTNCGNYDAKMRICLAVKPEAECDPLDPRFDPQDCPFWMSAQEVREKNEQRMRNIAALSAEQREHISLKYYDGAHPWNKYLKGEE